MLDPADIDLPEVTYRDGEQILVEGVRHTHLLVLISGTVSVTASGAPISSIDEPGAVFGEMAMLLDSPATATATAVGECRFKRADDAESYLRDHPQLALRIAGTLARRLDLVTRYLADLRNQYADADDHLAVVDEVLESLLHSTATAAQPGSEREPEAPY